MIIHVLLTVLAYRYVSHAFGAFVCLAGFGVVQTHVVDGGPVRPVNVFVMSVVLELGVVFRNNIIASVIVALVFAYPYYLMNIHAVVDYAWEHGDITTGVITGIRHNDPLLLLVKLDSGETVNTVADIPVGTKVKVCKYKEFYYVKKQ